MRRFLQSVWIAFVAVPVLIVRDTVLESRFLAAFAAVVWIAGWWRLTQGLTRDPDGGEALKAL